MKKSLNRILAKNLSIILAFVVMVTSIPVQAKTTYGAGQSVKVSYDYNWSSGSSHGTYPLSDVGVVGTKYPTFPDANQYYTVTYHDGESVLGSNVYSTLDGWYLDSVKLKQSDLVSKASDHTLSAKWSLGAELLPLPTRQYTIYFDDGSSENDSSVIGCTFEGWYTGTDFTTKIGNGGATYTPTSSLNLYAKWINGSVTLPAKSKTGTITFHVLGQSDSSISFTNTVSEWDNSYGTSIGTPGNTYEVTGDQTVYAKWSNEQITLPSASIDSADFVGWYDKPQSEDFYTNYGSTKIGVAGDSVSFLDSTDVYAWFNNKPYVTLEENNRTFYEGQTITGADLIDLIEVSDIESQEAFVDPVISIERITYSGGVVIEDVNEQTILDTSTAKIGSFTVTYRIEDAGILNDEIIDGSSSVIIFDLSCEIVSNHAPVIKFKSPYIYMDSADASLSSDTIDDYLMQQIESVTDVEDSADNLPWWSTKSDLLQHVELCGVVDLTLDPAYEKEYPESSETIAKVASLSDLMNLKLVNEELFDAITWFSVEYDVYDQFGKYASGRVTPSAQQKGVQISESLGQKASDRRILVLMSPKYDASKNKENASQFVNGSSKLDSNTYWGNDSYGKGFLHSVISLKERIQKFLGYNNSQPLITMDYESTYIQKTSGEDVSVHVTDYSAYAGLSDDALDDLVNGSGNGALYREIWEKASHEEKEQLAKKYPDIYEDVWNAYNKLLEEKDDLDQAKEAYDSKKSELPSDYQDIWSSANDSEREDLAKRYPDIFGKVLDTYKDYQQAQADYNTAKKEYEDALDRLSGTTTPSPNPDQKDLTNREKWENASYEEKTKLAEEDPGTFGKVKEAYDDMVSARDDYLDASDHYNGIHDRLSEEEQLTWDTASDKQKEDLAKKYPDIYEKIWEAKNDLDAKKDAYKEAKENYYNELDKLDGIGDGNDDSYVEPDPDQATEDDVFTLNFNGNGGGCSFTSKRIVYNQAYGSLPTASKTGYAFLGWYTNLSDGTKVSASTIHKIRSDVTLYARYSAEEYIITFDGNKGIGSSDVTVGTPSISVSRDQAYGYLPEDTSRVGYTFSGWYTSPIDGEKITSSTIVKLESDQTLYAHWKPNTYTVKFNSNKGSGSTDVSLSVERMQIEYDTVYGALPIPTRTGYTFDGWYTKISGGDKIESTTIFTNGKNQVLYAHWSPKNATLYFNTNAAFGSSVVTLDVPSKVLSFDSIYGDLPTPKRDGYTFLGWYDSLQENALKVTKDTRYLDSTGTSVMVYAHWKAKSYIVYFDPNRGSGSSTPMFGNGSSTRQSISVLYDNQIGSIPTISREGYIFSNWNTKSDGSGETYVATTKFRQNKNITLYAIWTEISYAKNEPSARNLVYSRSAQELILPATGVVGGTVYYKVVNGTNANSNQTSYATTIPTGTNAGTYTVYYYVAADGNHANSETRSLAVTIQKAKAQIETTASAKSLTYNGSNQTLVNAATTKDGMIYYKVGDGNYSTNLPVAKNAGTYTVSYYVRGDSNHTDSSVSMVSVTINKAKAQITNAPTNRNVTYTGAAQNLINAGTTNDGTIYYKLNNGGWSTSIPTATNAGSYTVYYYVRGDSNHIDSDQASLAVTIAKANAYFVTAPSAKSLTYNGNAQALLNAGTASAGTIKYAIHGGNWSTSVPTATNAGTYTVYYYIDGDANHNGTATATVYVTISKANSYYTVTPSAQNPTYNGNYQYLSTTGSAVGGTVYYKLYDHNNNWTSDWITYAPSSIGAGTYTVYYKIVGDANHNDTGEKSFTATINKANVSYGSPSAKSLTYNGGAQYLINDGWVSGGTMYYSTDNSNWSIHTPTGTNAGSYNVWYKIVGDSNHNGVGSTFVGTITINKAASSVSSAPTGKSLSYNGGAQYLINGGSASGGTMYYKVGNGGWSTSIPTATNAGTYTIYYYVKGDSNHNDTASSSVSTTISKIAGSVTLSASSGSVYSGNSTTFTASGTGTLSVSSNNTGVATASISNGTVTVTGVSAGTATITVSAATSTNYNAASASYSITVTSGFSWKITNWGNSYGNKVHMEEPNYPYAHEGDKTISGTTTSDTLYVCTTFADGPGWTVGDCWVEIELPAGTYRPRMSHSGQGTYLTSLVWNGSSWSTYDIDTTPGVNADSSSGTVWLKQFTITSTTRVRFRETNQGGGYSRAQVWLCKTS